MLCDQLKNWRLYQAILPELFQECFSWIEKNSAILPKPGKYNLSKGAYAIVQNYAPNPLKGMEFENHRKYIDLQVVLKGEERILWTKPTHEKLSKPYVDEKDIEFFVPLVGKIYTSLILGPGDFAIFWPSDWHIPCLQPVLSENSTESFANVDKIVIKIPV